MKLGKAKYGGEFTKRKYWRLQDGEATFRILPPMGDLADKGIWSQFYNVHYGYKNSKDQMRVFQSPLVKNRKTKMIEVPDAALERIEQLKAKFEEAKKNGDKALTEKLDKLVGQKGQFNLDNNHYVNAMDTQGNIGILKLRHRAKNALDATIKRLREQGVDPLSADDGRFFVFRRSGTGLDTTFQVDILQESLDIDGVGKVKRDLVHKLTDDIVTRLGNEAAKLDQLFKRPTSEQVARIVKEGARAVDEILDAKNDSSTEQVIEDDFETEEPTQTASVPTQTASTPAPAPIAASVVQAATPTPAKAAVPATTTTTAETVQSMSDEEFLKSLGLS